MGSRLIDTSLALVLVALLCGGAAAQSGCTSAITSLAPCLNYITANSSTPSSSCCTQLGNVIQSSPQCLCALLSGTGFNLGITINQTLALSLPGACNVQTPPMSQCNAVANGPSSSAAPPVSSPASSPSESPASSPSDSSNNGTPDEPAATTPPTSTVPSGTGSKTVPTTDVPSDGRIMKAPLHFLLFLLFIASTASSVVIF
ncbi:non-specific lipid transfer protein GPI-anchored 19-like [Tripterygium wilfordii]|uniref:non-specific lipid transfer protein GPI-anchored 19-like n=1 Tax=Tripterygium wilfordii TaxID=458696 RepID=UPI0018F7E87B|nr:non-specific lipid transfer protein GPI-anchored 19-like [Tripterygium wilfordii]